MCGARGWRSPKRASPTNSSRCRSAPTARRRIWRASLSPRSRPSSMTALPSTRPRRSSAMSTSALPGAPLQPEDVHQWSRMNQIIGIVDAYAWPSIAGAILYNRMLAPRLGGVAGRGGDRRRPAAGRAVPRRDRAADGGSPLSRRRACEPRRSDGDPAAPLFRQCARRPRPARPTPEARGVAAAHGNTAELPGDQATPRPEVRMRSKAGISSRLGGGPLPAMA